MKAYVGEGVLILTIALFAKWTNIVTGQEVGREPTEQEGVTEQAIRENTEQLDITELLSSVMQGLTDVTKKPLIMLNVPLGDVNERIRSLQTSYTDNCKVVNVENEIELNCNLVNDYNILTLRTVTENPQHVYLSVHQGNMPTDNSASDIESYCTTQTNRCLTCPPTTTCPTPTPCPKTPCPTTTPCPKTTCPTPSPCLKTTSPTPTHCPKTTCPIPTPCPKTTCPTPSPCPTTTTSSIPRTKGPPLTTCIGYLKQCRIEPNNSWCQSFKLACIDKTTTASITTSEGTTSNNQGSPCDLTGQDTQPSKVDDILPIVIASIVSFFVGAGVCLLVLCVLRHSLERLCLKPIYSSTYVAKTEKSHNQATKSQMNTTSTIAMTEHEYLDLRCDTMPNSEMSSFEPKQTNTAVQAPVYETMADAQKDHVYSGLCTTESNLETEYEHTLPKRSSEHMYSGMLHDTQSSDPTIRQQVNTPGRIADTNDNPMHDISDNQAEPNEYLILEKEKHCSNQPKPGQGPDLGDKETAEDMDDYHSYHTLHKI